MEGTLKDNSKKEVTSSQQTNKEEIQVNQNTLPSSASFETLNENNFEQWLDFNEFNFEKEKISEYWRILKEALGLTIKKKLIKEEWLNIQLQEKKIPFIILDALRTWAGLATSQAFSNPSELFQFIQNCGLKLKSTRDPKLVVEYKANLIDRKHSIKSFYDELEKRINNYKSLNHSLKLANALLSCVGAPGTGKSSFINSISNMNRISLASNQVQNMMKESVLIPVTFNYLTKLSNIEVEINYMHAFLVRLIDSYFFDEPKISTVLEKFKNVNLKEDLVIDTIFYSMKVDPKKVQLPSDQELTDVAKQRIFLFIDELIMLNELPKKNQNQKFSNAEQLVNDISRFMDNYGCAFNLFVTSLDSILIKQTSSNSGRPVFFIDLPRISFKRLKKLIDKNYSNLEPKFKALIIATCGHPRTLHAICEYLKKNNNSTMQFTNLLQDARNSFNVEQRVNHVSVLYALKAQFVSLENPIDGKLTVSEYIKQSYFFNAITNEDSIIPYTSIYSLLQFANREEQNLTSDISSESLKQAIKDLLCTNDGGFEYEIFHAKWEIIWRIIEPGHLPRYFPDDFRAKFPLVAQFRTFEHFSTNKFSTLVDRIEKDTYYKNVFSFCNNNDAFDFLIVERIQNSLDPLLFTFECKLSSTMKSKIKASDVIMKYKMGMKIFKENSKKKKTGFSELKIPTTHFFQVFIICCPLEDDFYSNLTDDFLPPPISSNMSDKKWKTFFFEKKNLLIVDSGDLKQLYGPSLSFLYRFNTEGEIPIAIQETENLSASGSERQKEANEKNKKGEKRKEEEGTEDTNSDLNRNNPKKQKITISCGCRTGCITNRCKCKKNIEKCTNHCECQNCKNN